MSLPKSRQSYLDCYRFLDAALNDRGGARIKAVDVNNAYFIRMRIHQARQLNRDDNKRLYAEDHPMYGSSPYDRLVIRIKDEDGNVYIYAEHVANEMGDIEPLTGLPPPDEDAIIEAEAVEVKSIEDQRWRRPS